MMLYVLLLNNDPVDIVSRSPYLRDGNLNREVSKKQFNQVESRWDWLSLQEVNILANKLTTLTGEQYVGTYSPSTAPNFDIVKVHVIGDKVSYCFNGDCYPDGVVVRVTSSLIVITSAGHRYRRYQNTGKWIMEGGTWTLVSGHIDERNPSF